MCDLLSLILGVAYWVFPGACHNRFEHCIGTSYLCAQMLATVKTLQENFYVDPIEITEKEIQCVKIAGLIHDLGHGKCFNVYTVWLFVLNGFLSFMISKSRIKYAFLRNTFKK